MYFDEENFIRTYFKKFNKICKVVLQLNIPEFFLILGPFVISKLTNTASRSILMKFLMNREEEFLIDLKNFKVLTDQGTLGFPSKVIYHGCVNFLKNCQKFFFDLIVKTFYN